MADKPRKFLTEKEVLTLLDAAAMQRYPERDRCIILMMYRHGLRVSEACALSLMDITLDSQILNVTRLKNGFSTVHPIRADELTMITEYLDMRHQLRRSRTAESPNAPLFLSNLGKGISRKTLWQNLLRISQNAGLQIKAHPHMLRHACGYELANKGLDTRLIQDYLGHRNIQHTVIYTAANPARFTKVWDWLGGA